jgi:hypothetical protein
MEGAAVKVLERIRPHWRKMTWALILWSALMLAWIISAGVGADCSEQVGHYQNAKQSGCEAGTGIAIAGLITLWFFGFVVGGLIWFMSRPKTPPIATASPE